MNRLFVLKDEIGSMEGIKLTNYEEQLIDLIKEDTYILTILGAVEELHLNDAWVCAGLIRNKVWDVLHNITTPINDIDVIYFDPSDTTIGMEKQLEKELKFLLPNQPWSVKNQARMHRKSGFNPFISSYDGVAHFPETPTAIAARLCNKELEIMAPYGLRDLFDLKVKPTSIYRKDQVFHSIYVERIKQKKWKEMWKYLSIEA